MPGTAVLGFTMPRLRALTRLETKQSE